MANTIASGVGLNNAWLAAQGLCASERKDTLVRTCSTSTVLALLLGFSLLIGLDHVDWVRVAWICGKDLSDVINS